MKSYPLVSVLIPAYNAEQWLAESIQSAMSQTWPRIELIIVDDGSRDETLRIARQFASESVKVVTQPNRGASAARNHALSLAQGDFIQWLDADDVLAPDKVSTQLRNAVDGDPGLLLSCSVGSFHRSLKRAKFEGNALWKDHDPVSWIVAKFANNAWMNPAAWLVSRQLTTAAGPWNEELSLDDDGEYFCRVVAASNHVRFIPEARIFYRHWMTGSLSRRNSDSACRSLLTSLSLSIATLRSLEDSARTRSASLHYLSVFFHYFYPGKTAMIAEIQDLAAELGSCLVPPKLDFKYSVIEKLFGWQAVRVLRAEVASLRLRLAVSIDKLEM